MVLPLILYYLTPNGISIIALAGLSAAAMSSADSAFLSSSTMFAHNVFKATKKMVRIKGYYLSKSIAVYVSRYGAVSLI